jgi:hypothetical protein
MAETDQFAGIGNLFGRPGGLFGSDTPQPRDTGTGRTILAIPKPTLPAEEQARPRLLKNLPGATEQVLVRDEPVDTDTLAPPVELRGALSAVRAALVLHQHEEKLWAQPNFPSHIGASTQPDLTQEEIDARYETLQLFSYLPPQLQLSREDFAAMLRPSARPTYLTANLARMGIDTGGATAAPAPGTTAAAATLPPNAPFAERLTQFCNDPYFTLANV